MALKSRSYIFLSWSCEVVFGNFLHSELFNGEQITQPFRIYINFFQKQPPKVGNLRLRLSLAAKLGDVESFVVLFNGVIIGIPSIKDNDIHKEANGRKLHVVSSGE